MLAELRYLLLQLRNPLIQSFDLLFQRCDALAIGHPGNNFGLPGRGAFSKHIAGEQWRRRFPK